MQAKHLLDLPPEILMGILQHVPNKMPSKLTCLDFYKTVCNLQAKKYRLVIKDENIKDYKLILRSIRSFDEISISIWNFLDFSVLRVIDILNKNSHSIKKISFSYTVIDEELLIRLLRLLPLLEELVLDVSLSNSSNDSQHKLSVLTQVRSVITRVESAKIIFELPNDNLTTLSFYSSLHDSPPSTEFLIKLFDKQRKIVNLNFDPLNIVLKSMETLSLKKLRLVNRSHQLQILQKQKSLEDLNLLGALKTEEFMKTCQLKRLRSLIVDVREIDSYLIKSLNDLIALEELSIRFDPSTQQMNISKLCLPNLLTLRLIYSSNFYLELSSLLISTKLKNLKLSQCNIDLFYNIIRKENLESLEIESLINCFPGNSKTYEIVQSNLKSLTIENSIEITNEALRSIVERIPRLQNIYLGNGSWDVESLALILKTCNRLTNLVISNTKNFLNVDLWRTLVKDHGKKLNYFEIGKVKLEASEGPRFYKKHFEAQFEFFIHKENKIIFKN